MRCLAKQLATCCLAAGLLFFTAVAGAAEPVGRSKAAALALAAFGGKVLSVEEVEKTSQASDSDNPAINPEVFYEVKLLQSGGRVKVVHLDAAGNIL